MGKIRISPKQKIFTRRTSNKKVDSTEKQKKELLSLKDFKTNEKIDTRSFLLNHENLGAAILDCLINNDPNGVMEVIGIYLRAANKEKFRQKAEIGKSTYYYFMKSKNPTIKTLAKVVHSIFESN